MNYLNSEQKEKLEKILNLQNNIEASRKKKEDLVDDPDGSDISSKNEKSKIIKELEEVAPDVAFAYKNHGKII